ncbi:GDSL esterase/lipase [Gossypium australe]|uniref:GDSL esterase/lipase n=1 Tax=Gossypium australe TaxID=47621 RepID=A0A5B6W7G1_9ROSI|nr:GDSL esterase/lipase [Gossypium australe]
MNPIASGVDKIKGFVHDLVKGRDYSSRRNPRQDKVERLLSFYKTSKENPFEGSNTLLRGEVDFLAAVLLMSKVDDEHWDGVGQAGIRTMVDSRFRFATTVGGKDTFGVEFMANQKRIENSSGDVYGTPLTLSKLFYKGSAGDWFSAIAIPFGAQFRDLNVTSASSLQEEKGLTDLSFGPPMLHQHNGGAIGVTVRRSNIIASLAQSFRGIGNEHCFSTFGQVVCQLPVRLKLSFLGLRRGPKMASRNFRLGALALPVGLSRYLEDVDTVNEAAFMPSDTNTPESGSVALMLESELDEYQRLGGWIEMKQTNPEILQWAVNLSDTSEDVFGWGVSVGGVVEGPRNWDLFQVESYVKLNLGKRCSLKPGIAYVVDGNSRTLALALRSNCSF